MDKDLDKLQAEIIKERRAILEKDILKWGKYYFADKFTAPFCEELHRYFISIRNEKFTSTLAPRGHAKTVIKCFLIPLYQALVEPDVFLHYLNIQSTTSKAIDINNSIKNELEENEKLIRDYGFQVTNAKWTEKKFVLQNGVIFSAIGAGESLRGINYRNKRPDYIICDDLYDDDDIKSLIRLDKKNNWFWSSLYPARALHKRCSIHVQGTAISKADLMHKLAKNTQWKFNKFQAIKDIDNKEVLWKENPAFSYDNLIKDKQNMGSVIFEREMQNNFRDDETAIIKQSWIKTYKHSEYKQLHKSKKIICGLDPACGEGRLNDYSGYAIIHVDENMNVYIENALQVRNSFSENMRLVQMWHTRYQPDVFKIEAIAGFKQLADEIKRTTDVRLRAITNVKDKITRLELQSFRFENGKVFINEEMDQQEFDNLVEQLINNFPVHDDVRDAVIICMEELNQNRGVKSRIL